MKTRAIVISSIKYQDKALIVKCFTLADGLKSYFVRDAFSTSRKLGKKSAYFQVLTILEIEADHRNKNTLEHFKNIKPVVYQSIPMDILKSTMVLFLSEVLSASLKDESKNEDLFLFLEASLLWLDQNKVNVNFHLVLLMEMTKFFGFYPSADSKSFFEMTEGIFTDIETQTCLSFSETELLKSVLKQRIYSTENQFNNTDRAKLLEIILDYYALHIENFKKPRSLEVFKEVFS